MIFYTRTLRLRLLWRKFPVHFLLGRIEFFDSRSINYAIGEELHHDLLFTLNEIWLVVWLSHRVRFLYFSILICK